MVLVLFAVLPMKCPTPSSPHDRDGQFHHVGLTCFQTRAYTEPFTPLPDGEVAVLFLCAGRLNLDSPVARTQGQFVRRCASRTLSTPFP